MLMINYVITNCDAVLFSIFQDSYKDNNFNDVLIQLRVDAD